MSGFAQASGTCLAAALAERPVGARAGHLKGRLMLREQAREPWRQTLRKRNWRE